VISLLYYDSMRIKRREKISVLELRGGIEESSIDPYSIFLFAMRLPKTREKCTGRLRSKQMNNSDPERK
jgi:hypothetical protein